jgi:hypothetical protein
LIHIDLTERVIARKPATPGQPMQLHHAPEPRRAGSTPTDAGWTGGPTDSQLEHWELWVLDQKVGEWTSSPT